VIPPVEVEGTAATASVKTGTAAKKARGSNREDSISKCEAKTEKFAAAGAATAAAGTNWRLQGKSVVASVAAADER
jgi:hypothetical protein